MNIFIKLKKNQGNSGNLSKEHHKLVGWNTRQDGKGKHYRVGGTASLKGETVLYAEWKPVEYIIKYDRNGATQGTKPNSQKFTYPFTDSIRDSRTLKKAGYTFLGWNTKPDGMETVYLPGARPSVAENITLYAIWGTGPNYVMYNANGASGGVPAYSYKPNVKIYIEKADTLNREHYTFAGWDTDPLGRRGVRFQPKQLVSFMGGLVSLYAQWEENRYTITYDGNGYNGIAYPGNVPSAKLDIKALTSVTVNHGSEMDWSGYIFMGWSTNPNGPVEYLRGSLISDRTITLTENMMLYAIWEIPVSGVELTDQHIVLYPGETHQLTAQFTPGNATDKSLSWRVQSNNGVVSVDDNGLVEALDVGRKTVTAISTAASSSYLTARDSCVVQVVPQGSIKYLDLTVTEPSIRINKGAQHIVTAKVTPAIATATWKTSNSFVATVDSNGRITANEKGVAEITAEVKCPTSGRTLKKTILVVVSEPHEYDAFLQAYAITKGYTSVQYFLWDLIFDILPDVNIGVVCIGGSFSGGTGTGVGGSVSGQYVIDGLGNVGFIFSVSAGDNYGLPQASGGVSVSWQNIPTIFDAGTVINPYDITNITRETLDAGFGYTIGGSATGVHFQLGIDILLKSDGSFNGFSVNIGAGAVPIGAEGHRYETQTYIIPLHVRA